MKAGKLIGYIAAAIFIFFGILFVWGAFSEQGNPSWILVGLIGIGAGFGLIWLVSRATRKAGDPGELIQRIELSGDVDLETLQCRNCGGALSAENITMVAGAPVVNCPYCGTSYQLTEEPKW